MFVAKNGTVENLTEKDGRYDGSIAPVNTATTEFIWTINTGVMQRRCCGGGCGRSQGVFGPNGNASTGMVDTARAVDGEGKGFVPNLSLIHASHGAYGVEVKPFAPMRLCRLRLLTIIALRFRS